MCRQRRSDTEMLRVSRDATGTWILGRGDGRGAWWCDDTECGENLRVAHLARALRSAVHEGDVATVRALARSARSKRLQL